MTAAFLLGVCLSAAPARAAGPASVPGSGAPIERPAPKKEASVTRLSLAISLAFDTSTWAKIGVSTAAPAVDIAALIGRGHYRLEILQMVLIADRLGSGLSEIVTEREKAKKTLRVIAEGAGLDYEQIYEAALAKGRAVDRRAADLAAVPVRRR